MEALDCPRARVEDSKTPDMLQATDSRGERGRETHLSFYLAYGADALWLCLHRFRPTDPGRERSTSKMSFRV